MQLCVVGSCTDPICAGLLSDRLRRKLRIYTNVIRLVDSPNERILIIYGAGHLAWLRRNFSSDPTVQLRTLAEFANFAGVSQ